MAAYRLQKLSLGAEVFGINLADQISSETVQNIKSDLWKHRLLVFREQPSISGARQAQIGRWFGELDSEPFFKHPASPSTDVFRVSNDENEGCRGVGRTGWHIDGSFRNCPYSVSVYYMASTPRDADTRFVGLKELLESLSEEQKANWNRLWMLSDRRSGICHPLTYTHPITKEPTVCFHLGMTDCFVWDKGSEKEKFTNGRETNQILQEIHCEIVKNDEMLVYSHKWQPGDFILSDNLALGHEASPQSQLPVSQVGLRILHRVTVAGKHKPTK